MTEIDRLRRENAQLKEREEQLSQELAAAYRHLESFTHSIAHDLRAPLRSIDSFAQILEEDVGTRLDAEERRLIGVIRNGSRKMDQLILGLLDFSRAGSRPLEFDRIDMTAVAEAAAIEVRTHYSGTTPLIEIAELPAAKGDAAAIRQVWCNLIGNAVKYSAKQPSPRVTVSGRSENAETVYRVEDNGAGFDMRYADKLFGVFQRLHRAEEFDGTGVGLAIVQCIVRRHGGRVWATGIPDGGASVQFALPFVPGS
jgi:light-regulated signal transduction histidine kinase (bacteriophytochrome)